MVNIAAEVKTVGDSGVTPAAPGVLRVITPPALIVSTTGVPAVMPVKPD